MIPGFVSEEEKTMNYEYEWDDIPVEKFRFVQRNQILRDEKPQTKPIGYFKDAMLRFVKNKGSVVCFGVILLLIIYALTVPVFSKTKGTFKDSYYSYALPSLSPRRNLGFWNGCSVIEVNSQGYDFYSAIPGAIVKDYGKVEKNVAGRPQTFYKISVDSYAKVGYEILLLTKGEYEAALTYEKDTGIQLFYPMIDQSRVKNRSYKEDGNGWFLTDQKGNAIRDKEGNLQPVYLEDETSPDGYAYSIVKMKGSQYQVRVLYKDWFVYKNGFMPNFIFGADQFGYDIFSRLAIAARLSLVLSVCIASINLIIGIVIGALEGYYGGRFDLIMERIKEILYQIPTIVFMTLFQIYFARKLGAVLTMFVCFIFFGWIAASSTVRAQFYRFKGQEYVMAARTLGAKDRRLIFRHILPNAAGFIVTTSVLSIPGFIFSEANLTFLGIVNLQSSNVTSVGTMLNNGQSALATYPHCVLFPAAFISILLICFNIFGNGLRDAFNPSLRGIES